MEAIFLRTHAEEYIYEAKNMISDYKKKADITD
jgi:hypothetical protein